jgi:hypothetical protein
VCVVVDATSTMSTDASPRTAPKTAAQALHAESPSGCGNSVSWQMAIDGAIAAGSPPAHGPR